MDINKQEQTIETLPGFKPLTVVPWSSGYGVDMMCDGMRIGHVDENWRDQYRAVILDHFSKAHGRGAAYDYFETQDAAIKFIRDRWIYFVNELIVGGGPVWIACKIAGKVG